MGDHSNITQHRLKTQNVDKIQRGKFLNQEMYTSERIHTPKHISTQCENSKVYKTAAIYLKKYINRNKPGVGKFNTALSALYRSTRLKLNKVILYWH